MFTQISGYKLKVQSFGRGRNRRIIVFASDDATDSEWERVEHANVLIAGQTTKAELGRFLNNTTKSRIMQAIPGGISSRALTSIREHLGIKKARGRPRISDIPGSGESEDRQAPIT